MSCPRDFPVLQSTAYLWFSIPNMWWSWKKGSIFASFLSNLSLLYWLTYKTWSELRKRQINCLSSSSAQIFHLGLLTRKSMDMAMTKKYEIVLMSTAGLWHNTLTAPSPVDKLNAKLIIWTNISVIILCIELRIHLWPIRKLTHRIFFLISHLWITTKKLNVRDISCLESTTDAEEVPTFPGIAAGGDEVWKDHNDRLSVSSNAVIVCSLLEVEKRKYKWWACGRWFYTMPD